MKHAHALRG